MWEMHQIDREKLYTGLANQPALPFKNSVIQGQYLFKKRSNTFI